MGWPNDPRPAKALVKLRQQVNDTWPNRNKASDGLLGNTEHASRSSDHNPWLQVNGIGVVTAFDITKDEINGPPSMAAFARTLTSDARTKYVIYDHRIWKARTGRWEAYHGPSSHTHHVHVSIKAEAADAEQQWVLNIDIPAHAYPILHRGDRGQAVREVQAKLGITVDGIFGPATEQAVKEFQGALGMATTGIVDGETWKELK